MTGARLTFGKYRGCDVGDVPLGYLRWVRDNAFDKLSFNARAAIDELLADDGRGAAATPTLGVDPAAVKARVRLVYGAMSRRHHPDVGGDAGRQAVVVEFYHELLKALEDFQT